MRQCDYLKFINYPIIQDSEMFKVNTDTAILGMFLDEMKNKTVLDIGTNNGALLLYALYHQAGHLVGIDIQKEALKLAEENLSNYTKDYELHHVYVQDLKLDPVDVIICNPPFFENGNERDNDFYKTAMYEKTLPLADMFASFRRYLKDNGEVYTLYPAERFPEFYAACVKYKMKIMKIRFVHDKKRPYAQRFVAKLKIGKMTKMRVLAPIMVEKGYFEIM